ncbi:MAG: DUF2147 domain-containing protein, partial [Woeseiaceae bacterium]|nr:DUF2147 domain-containing protein [Woeseiaceae bacterium]
STLAWADKTDIEGRWLTQKGDGWIRIQIVGDSLEGSVAGSPDPKQREERKFDDRNPDTNLRTRRLEGLTIMTGFEYGGDGHWSGGTVYDPNSGKTYKCTVKQLDANTLKIRGFIGISLFGRSETWTRDDE